MQRFMKAKEAEGYQDLIGEEYPLLQYLALGKLTLKQGQTYEAQTNGYETALVILSGKAAISAEDQRWTGLGGRNNVFEGKATTVFVPCQSAYQVTAETDLQIAVCKVKAEEKYAPFVVRPEEVVVQQRGKAQWNREVHDIIADNANNRVQRIVLGETFHKPGEWSGYPPHKHDGEFAPEEPNLEEIYYYQVNPQQGFGVQLHYTKDLSIDEAHIIRHGDSFAIDKGYHPVVAGGGYQLYYLWFMAGESGRTLRPYEDPDHRWLHTLD
ncbi:5-deoxy-glucuronate isomerase [Brevibacillus fulvus]|uniref:5-deoxy-glucuronate isomerase n=1 Tax=Brevibacillus fulvus TaxID=1125967 RepID=A0A939BU75_9BACL|nr:5-deoxy-glucuronate isomerase [Brevibacillus fulvus]MBM7589231.1 5-deoxy-glucuronate isomerase [Brevibacillus fulvus]